MSPLRYGSQSEDATTVTATGEFDIDFHCQSYDVWFEKPDQRIFTAATDMMNEITRAQEGWRPIDTDLSSWERLYVGDDYDKDAVGALNAGWHPILLTSNAQEGPGHVLSLEQHAAWSIDAVFAESSVVSVHSIEALVSWLLGRM